MDSGTIEFFTNTIFIAKKVANFFFLCKEKKREIILRLVIE